jgi:hypothetical protein
MGIEDDYKWVQINGEWTVRKVAKEDEKVIKCECGTTKTLGEHDDPQFHSDWCPIYRKGNR